MCVYGKCRPPRVLVDDDMCTITYCEDCRGVDVSLGAMTLRLTAKQFEDLSGSFGRAVEARCGKALPDPAELWPAPGSPIH